MKYLIRGAAVLTMGAKTPNFAVADVLVDGARIDEVGPGVRARDAEVIDGTDTIVMPGFVDTHRHAWKSLLRNVGVATGGANIVASEAFSDHFTPEDCYAATLIGLLGAIEGGTTTVVDWFDLGGGPEHLQAALEAHSDAGLRTVFACGAAPGSSEPLVTTLGLTAPSDRTTLAFAAPDLSSSTGQQWAGARRAGLRIHAHAGTGAGDGGTVAALGRDGLLGPDVTLVHGTRLDDHDLDAIAASGTSVAVAPSVEMAAGIGSPPMQRLIDRDIRPGLAVDDERLAPGDMFAQMRSVISMQHARYFDLKLAGKAGLPNLLNTRETIRYATVDGARAAGLAHRVGTIEPGLAADVIVLRTDRPNIWPINDPIGAVVWGMDTSNVSWVFVAGRPLMQDGVLAADTGGARELAAAALHRVGSASGLLTPLGATR